MGLKPFLYLRAAIYVSAVTSTVLNVLVVVEEIIRKKYPWNGTHETSLFIENWYSAKRNCLSYRLEEWWTQ